MTITENFLVELDQSLKTKYDFLRLEANPAVCGARNGTLTTSQLEWALAQYSFLPMRIVEILGTMASAVYTWPAIHDELLGNIEQECGVLTKNCAHISILRDCLRKELGLDLTAAKPCDASDEFLDGLVNCVRTQRESKEFIAGMAYALEASAIPELSVVAELINRVWLTRGNRSRLITKHETESRRSALRLTREKDPKDYTLEDFFVIHLLYIEMDHCTGLKKILQDDVQTDEASNLVQDGFKFVLDSMAIWWTELTRIAGEDATSRN